MKTMIAAAALIAATLSPALAEDIKINNADIKNSPVASPLDETSNSLIGAWNDMDRGRINLRNAIVVLVQERESLQGQIAHLRERCGAACVEPPAPPPAAKTEPNPAPKPAQK